MEETWKPINGYEGYYEVSNLGVIKSLGRITCDGRRIKGRIFKPSTSRGYPCVNLSINSKVKRYKVHRLVALHFIPNPDNKPQVNHKDGNKLNNKVENLEWCTASENIQHAYENGLQIVPKGKNNPLYGRLNKHTSKKIIDIKTGKIFNSVNKAAKYAGIKRSTLSAMLINQNPNKTNLRYYND